MVSTQEIKNKEVINIFDGKSLGFAEDIELNLEMGTIEALIIPGTRGFFGLFSKQDDIIIKWRDIKRIGDDVILVEISGYHDNEYDYEYDYKHKRID